VAVPQIALAITEVIADFIGILAQSRLDSRY
jgi:hypothetical protein